MRKKIKYFLSIILIMATLLMGCSTSQSTQTDTGTSDTNTTTTINTATTTDTTTTASAATSTSTTSTIATALATTSTVVVDTEFTASDLDVGYEDTTATHVSLNGSSIDVSGNGATAANGVLTISDEGTYVITGTLSDGQIIVDAEDADKVQIVLNGVSITCSDNAPIYIKNADKVFITLESDTVNTLTDGTEYVQSDDNTVDGVIFSTADLTINGNGTLNITGNYKHGIASKDDLVITGGTFNITAVQDALNGKDCVKINDGTFILTTETGNGIQSKNGDDTTKGYVYICGGTITVTNSQEGIEGTAIVIKGGTIDITAQDDGFNSASGSSDEAATDTDTANAGFGGGGAMEVDTNCYISISGGTITVDAAGDGIDSNGSVSISGGTLYVSGPTDDGNAGFDYNGTADITGGIVIIAGTSGMAQGFSDTSSQYSLLYNFTAASAAGTEISLKDADGNVVASFTPDKQYSSVVISTPDLVQDGTYTLVSGEQTADITLSTMVTSNGQTGMGGFGGPSGNGKGGMGRP